MNQFCSCRREAGLGDKIASWYFWFLHLRRWWVFRIFWLSTAQSTAVALVTFLKMKCSWTIFKNFCTSCSAIDAEKGTVNTVFKTNSFGLVLVAFGPLRIRKQNWEWWFFWKIVVCLKNCLKNGFWKLVLIRDASKYL